MLTYLLQLIYPNDICQYLPACPGSGWVQGAQQVCNLPHELAVSQPAAEGMLVLFVQMTFRA